MIENIKYPIEIDEIIIYKPISFHILNYVSLNLD